MADEELTPEQIAEQKERVRELALRNLASTQLTDLAAAYFVDKSGQYGEAGNSAIEQFKYFPAIQSPDGSKLITESLLGSRQDGKRYSGNVSEYNIISDAAKTIQRSLGGIFVEDMLNLINSQREIKQEYENKYLSDLFNSKNQEEKELAGKLFGDYMQYLTDSKVSEALGERASTIKSGLEEILTEPEQSKE